VPVPVAAAVVVTGCALLVNVRVALAAPVTCGLNVKVKAALCPAVMTAGSDKPLIVKLELFELAAVTVTLAPVALRLPAAVPLAPTNTLPTARVAGVALNCPAATVAVPASEMVRLGLVPFELTVTFPLALPAAVGVKVTLKFALCPAPKVTGVESPLNAKPAPLAATREIVTLDPPVFVTVSDRTWLLPTCTVPNSRLVGLAPSAPGVTPAPESAMDNAGSTAFEVIARLPLALPADSGAKTMLKVVFAPALSASGLERPLRLNPVPLTTA